jgi:hypothetical protein
MSAVLCSLFVLAIARHVRRLVVGYSEQGVLKATTGRPGAPVSPRRLRQDDGGEGGPVLNYSKGLALAASLVVSPR